MELKKIKYEELNARQKENYNYHKVASKLADYGYDCMRLNNDWQGADFIAVHNDGEKMLKVQLKARFTIAEKYSNKEIWIAFLEDGVVYMYDHDLIVSKLKERTLNSKSWKENKQYSQMPIPKIYTDYILTL
jgi:frataxin-like iron-binding protein CyaY